eukprot:365869-Chlamydomonas_euryale.AAC.12
MAWCCRLAGEGRSRCTVRLHRVWRAAGVGRAGHGGPPNLAAWALGCLVAGRPPAPFITWQPVAAAAGRPFVLLADLSCGWQTFHVAGRPFVRLAGRQSWQTLLTLRAHLLSPSPSPTRPPSKSAHSLLH